MMQRVLTILVALFVSVWIARHLGPAKFGQLNFALSFATLFATLAPLGLPRIIERDIVRDKSTTAPHVSTAFFLVLMGALACYAIMSLTAYSRGYDNTSTVLILIIGFTAFFQANTILEAYILSNVQAKSLAIANVIALSISNVFKIAFILNNAPLSYFAFAFVLDGLLLLPILLVTLRNTDGFPRAKQFSLPSARYLLKQSWPYILTGLFISLYMKIDVVMIKEMLGDSHAGQYSAAVRLSEGFYFIPLTLVASVYPAIVNAKKHSDEQYKSRLSNLYSLMIFLSISISLVFFLAAPYLIGLLYGPAYADATTVLSIHVWASVFVFLGVSSARWLLTENLQKVLIVNTAIGAATNIFLNWILIPTYGINGAAWASVISYGISGYLCFAFWNNTRANFTMMTKAFVRLPKLRN